MSKFMWRESYEKKQTKRRIQAIVQLGKPCDFTRPAADLAVWEDCGAIVAVTLATMFWAGRAPTASTVCGPSWPEPSITWTPMEGTPFTTTKIKAGPGAMMAGLGGSWLTWRMAVLLAWYAVYDDASWTYRWPMFYKKKKKRNFIHAFKIGTRCWTNHRVSGKSSPDNHHFCSFYILNITKKIGRAKGDNKARAAIWILCKKTLRLRPSLVVIQRIKQFRSILRWVLDIWTNSVIGIWVRSRNQNRSYKCFKVRWLTNSIHQVLKITVR